MKNLKNLLFLVLIILVYSCNNQPANNEKQNANDSLLKTTVNQLNIPSIGDKIKIEISPAEKGKYVIGNKIEITVSFPDSIKADSVNILANNKQIASFTKPPYKYTWQTTTTKVGTNLITAVLNIKGLKYKNSSSIKLLSDVEPTKYTYKVIKSYPHDIHAYTQGLFIDNGVLYEATGLEGESTLRITQLENGQVVQSFTVPDRIFGEGITLFNNKIIQLSWRNHIGFVYDKKSFDVLEKFNYPTEGWGLTNDGQKLIMSDGTEKLYFLETQSYSKIDEIEVYDNKGEVLYLNELEYIDGQIYANVYQTDKIAIIDLKTGKVTAWIDLKGILSEDDRTKETDVLNGIAYDGKKKKLFVTGKRWSKLFEIQLIKK